MYKKILFKILKCFKCSSTKPLTSSERYVIMVLSRLVRESNTELFLHPDENKYYIYAKDYGVLIVCVADTCSTIMLMNHKYNYTIYLHERASTRFKDIFLNAVRERRDSLELQFLNNTENSLRSFHNNLLKQYEASLATKS